MKFDQNVLFCATCMKPVLHVDMNLDDREAVFDNEHPNVTQMSQLLIDYGYLITNIR